MVITLGSSLIGLAGIVALASSCGFAGVGAAALASYVVRAGARRWTLRALFGLTLPFAPLAPPLLAATGAGGAIILAYRIGAATAAAALAGPAVYAIVIGAWLGRPRARATPRGFLVEEHHAADRPLI